MGMLGKLKRQKRKEARKAKFERAVHNTALAMETIKGVSLILFTAAREVFGFGEKRLSRLFMRVRNQAECRRKKYVELDEIKQVLLDEAGVDLRGCTEHDDEEGKIMEAVVDELSATFLISLMDEFGYKQKPLSRFYTRAVEISKAVKNKEILMDDMEANLRAAKFRLE